MGYQKRINYLINLLNNQLLILKYKIKFIKDILAEKIIIKKRTKANVIDQIIELKFPKLSARNNEECSFRYLTELQIFSLTSDKIEEFEKAYNEKNKDLQYYINITPKKLWEKEL